MNDQCFSAFAMVENQRILSEDFIHHFVLAYDVNVDSYFMYIMLVLKRYMTNMTDKINKAIIIIISINNRDNNNINIKYY